MNSGTFISDCCIEVNEYNEDPYIMATSDAITFFNLIGTKKKPK